MNEKQTQNLEIYMEHGAGLRYDYQTWIVAKDPERRRVLRQGYGGMGIGKMWGEELEGDRESEEWQNAPIESGVCSRCGRNLAIGCLHCLMSR